MSSMVQRYVSRANSAIAEAEPVVEMWGGCWADLNFGDFDKVFMGNGVRFLCAPSGCAFQPPSGGRVVGETRRETTNQTTPNPISDPEAEFESIRVLDIWIWGRHIEAEWDVYDNQSSSPAYRRELTTRSRPTLD
jgi:hypothetical protein